MSYQREYLARLCYPVANPNPGYEFSMGYYSRVMDRLHGLVTRLFMTPLIRSLGELVGPQPLLTFLDVSGIAWRESSPWCASWRESTGSRETGGWRSV